MGLDDALERVSADLLAFLVRLLLVVEEKLLTWSFLINEVGELDLTAVVVRCQFIIC